MNSDIFQSFKSVTGISNLKEEIERFVADSLEIMSPDVRHIYEGRQRRLVMQTTVPVEDEL